MEEDKKRKQEDVEEQVEEEIEDVDEDVVDVDFGFFDPKEIDYHAISGLLRQLLDADSTLFDISSLADSILKTPGGTTIKVDGDDNDPFAIFAVLDLTPEQPIDVINTLIEYFISKTAKTPEFNRKLRKIFKSSSNSSKVGLIICERLINMPPQVIPPMYRLYLNNTQNQTYDYYIILTKSFIEEVSKLDQEDTPLVKKKKRSLLRAKETFYFHPEDETIHRTSEYFISYPFTNQAQESDSKRAFHELGIYPKGHLIFIKGDKFEQTVTNMEQDFSV